MQFFDGLGGGKTPACKSAHKGASRVNLRAGHARPLRLTDLKICLDLELIYRGGVLDFQMLMVKVKFYALAVVGVAG